MLFFFFNDTATTEIYTLSLHDALPISPVREGRERSQGPGARRRELSLRRADTARWSACRCAVSARRRDRSEEHTSELQSHLNLVCRLLLEKKKKTDIMYDMCSH